MPLRKIEGLSLGSARFEQSKLDSCPLHLIAPFFCYSLHFYIILGMIYNSMIYIYEVIHSNT